MFTVTGSGYLGGAQVTVRGARIGADGTFGFFWSTFAAADGTVTMRLPVPRVPGITITVNGIRPG